MKKEKTYGMNIGASSLLIIIVILCLVCFAGLSAVSASDKVMTLSTCHGLHSNNRTIILGVLVASEDR